MARGNERHESGASPGEAKERLASEVEALESRAEARAQDWTAGLGDHAENIAQAMHSAGQTLRGKENWLADAAENLSSSLEKLSRAAREKGVREMRDDLEHFARERPALFMGAAVSAGLALGRLLRSSEPRAPNGTAAAARDEPVAARASAPSGMAAGMTGTSPPGGAPTGSPTYAPSGPEGGRHGAE